MLVTMERSCHKEYSGDILKHQSDGPHSWNVFGKVLFSADLQYHGTECQKGQNLMPPDLNQ